MNPFVVPISRYRTVKEARLGAKGISSVSAPIPKLVRSTIALRP